jgi:hypothetical protein
MSPTDHMFGVPVLIACALPLDVVEELISNGEVIFLPELSFDIIDDRPFGRVALSAGRVPKMLGV